jgi:hypothetical protein
MTFLALAGIYLPGQQQLIIGRARLVVPASLTIKTVL